MKRRGRPPHPDILTPREWEVLSLLREGHSNPEIAERLGITRDAVKYHVSEILSRLGVSSREEAALWSREPVPTGGGRWLAALSALLGRLPAAGRMGLIGTAGAALAGLAVLAWGVLATSGNDADSQHPRSTTTGGAAATATSEPTTVSSAPAPPLPQALAGKEIIALAIGPEIEFPQDLALMVATGCAPCDAPADGLLRVYRDGGGAQRVDDLLSVERVDVPPRIVETPEGISEKPPQLVAFAVNADGSEMFAAFCTRGECVRIEGPSVDAEAALFRSSDGGITWQQVGNLSRVMYFPGIVGRGRLLVASRADDGTSAEFRVFPTRETLTPPVPGASVFPIVQDSGEILFWDVEQRAVLRGDGSIYLDARDVPDVSAHLRAVSTPDGSRSVGSIQYQREGVAVTYLLEVGGGTPVRAFAADRKVQLGVWSESGLIFGHAWVGPWELPGHEALPFRGLPAVIDLDNHVIRPITGPFLKEPFSKVSVGIMAVQNGPFARVVNTEGDCLNNRAEPLPSAGILDCAAEGVLLRDTGETGGPAGEWLKIVTPAGAEGWASTQYLGR